MRIKNYLNYSISRVPSRFRCFHHFHFGNVSSNRTSSIVTVPPKIVPFSFGDEPANFGEPASVQCSVVLGDFPIDIVWLLNGRVVNEEAVSTAKLGKRLSVLNIDAVADLHAGNYTCAASNLAGQAEHSSLLRVNGQNQNV